MMILRSPAVPVLVILLTFTLPAAARQVAKALPQTAAERIAPPETLSCDRNQLTSFNGVVTAFQRDRDKTVITIYTDWDTKEVVELSHSDEGSPLSFFRLLGKAFTKDDWSRIESQPGVLIDGTRIIAWICSDDDTATEIDWHLID